MKEDCKKHLIDIMKLDEELGIYEEEPKQNLHLEWWKSLSTWYLKTEMMKKYGYDSKLVDKDIDLHPDDIKIIWEQAQKESKQETLEEAAERYIKEYDVEHYISIEDFIMGAKWQQKNSYSDEEVLTFAQIILSQYKCGNTNIEQLNLLKETLHQFKEK